MDFSSLKDTVSNLTLYDLKASVRKVQNAVMNYTEMESKVREATNNEPWGASSTLMQEIANGTFNYQTLNEIMPMIYRRFTEKSAEEWRQIYKSLQLLEFLIKHGSERVVDDARSHLTLLKMLRQFHYIDQNGKDQGINVRNRAKELAELLGDVDRIRAERKKARTNKAKFTGTEGGAGDGFSGSSSGRYGGFGSESGGTGGSSAGYGGYSGGVYGDGGVFGGQAADYHESGGSRADRFEEYDEFDEGARPAAPARTPAADSTARAGVRRTTPSSSGTAAAAAPPKKKKEPEIDILSFDDEPAPAFSAAPVAAAAASNDDDDFDDFQSATPEPSAAHSASLSINSLASLSLSGPPLATSNASGAQFAAPKPVSAPQQASLSGMVGMSSISPPPSSANYSAFNVPAASAAKPPAAGFQPSGPNYFQSVQVSAGPQTSVFPQSLQQQQQRHTSGAGMAALRPVTSTTGGFASANKSSGGGDAFGALWSTAIKKPTNTGGSAGGGPSMGQLAQEKVWGAPASSSAAAPKPATMSSSSNGLDDLLG